MNRLDEQNKHILWNWSHYQSNDFNYAVRTSILKWKQTIQSTWWNHRFGVVILIPIILSWWKKSRNNHQDFFHPTVMYTPPKFNTNTPNDAIFERRCMFQDPSILVPMLHFQGVSLVYIWTISHAHTAFSPTWDPLNIQYQKKRMGMIESVQTQALHIEITNKKNKQQPHQKKTSNNAFVWLPKLCPIWWSPQENNH